MTITQFALLASALFSLGVYGVLVRRNAVMVLLSVELMLAAVTLNFVAFGSFLNDEIFAGQIFASSSSPWPQPRSVSASPSCC